MADYNFSLLTFFSSFFISTSLIPFLLRIGKKLRKNYKTELVNRNPELKIRLGGVAIYLGSIVSTFIFFFISNKAEFISYENFFYLISCSFLIFLLGLADDLFNLPPIPRLLSQILITSFLWGTFLRIETIDLSMTDFFNFQLFLPKFASYLITILWIVGVTNAINWLDGLDGLASGYSFVSFIALFFLFFNSSSIFLSIFCISISGSCLGFLIHNIHPAKIIMGDCGSNILGYSLGLLSVMAVMTNQVDGILYTQINFIPIIILSLPTIDMVYVILSRIKDKKSPFYPDSRHFHHRLIDMNFEIRSIFLIVIFLTQFLSLAALIISRNPYISSAIFIFLIFDIFILYFSKKKLSLKFIKKNS